MIFNKYLGLSKYVLIYLFQIFFFFHFKISSRTKVVPQNVLWLKYLSLNFFSLAGKWTLKPKYTQQRLYLWILEIKHINVNPLSIFFLKAGIILDPLFRTGFVEKLLWKYPIRGFCSGIKIKLVGFFCLCPEFYVCHKHKIKI